ncbi:hypothetical protein JTB14_026507 [Gonioctena quinquepunctata]|nr:hypothetical protein JTB14_026507 [Gonioctena quinquepunctata]
MDDKEDSNEKNSGNSSSDSRTPDPSRPNYLSKIEIEKIEAHIATTYDKTESRRPKTSIKLPREFDGSGPSCEKDNVGDDISKGNEQNILCECQPNVAGAAIPLLHSFSNFPSTSRESDEHKTPGKISENKKNLPDDEGEVKRGRIDTILNSSSDCVASTSVKRSDEKLRSKKVLETISCEEKLARNFHKTPKKSPVVNSKGSIIVHNPAELTKKTLKKPSLIPKLSRPNSSNNPIRDCGKMDLLTSQEKVRRASSSNKLNKSSTKRGVDCEDNTSLAQGTSRISSKMTDLQERLKATTSMLRHKFDNDKNKTSKSSQNLHKPVSVTSTVSGKTITNILSELLRNISQIKETALKVQNSSTQKIQKKYIEKLFVKISEIQKIADKLSELEKNSNKEPEAETPENTKHEDPSSEKATKKTLSIRENKIYIKFMQAKDKNKEARKKMDDLPKDNTEGVQTDVALGSKLTSESLDSEQDGKKNQKEHPLKDSDSMDGVFIPSCEPPMHTEEEDETNGLDITITFPEFSNALSNKPASHLSVRVSDISAEALRKLKRCPKDFTLRMDFVQGKLLFQSGKAPVNNFSIGPDLKFVENVVVDDKMSDIISIKPSTECHFASQLISVENVNKELGSYRSLRATDSELFSVVNLPLNLYRNPSAVTKSCMAFNNDRLFSMAILAGQLVRSMPQIPCLANIGIVESGFIEHVTKAAAFQMQGKNRKSRQDQKKSISSGNNP